MNKKIFYITLYVIFCKLSFAQHFQNESIINTDADVIFEDDFEDYSPGTFPSGTWDLIYNGNGTYLQEIVNDQCVSPTQSFKLEGAPNWSGEVGIILPYTPPVIYYEANVMTANVNHRAILGFSNQQIGPRCTVYTWLAVGENGYIFCGEPLQTCEAYKWYHIKLKYDTKLDLCDVWIDGILKGQNIPCLTNGEYNGFRLETHHPASSTKAWFDDIIIYADSPLPEIVSIKDVPDDYGQQVRVFWNRSNLDVPDISSPVTKYSIWRIDKAIDLKHDHFIVKEPTEISINSLPNNNNPIYWQQKEEILTFITMIPALQSDQYSVIAPTLYDSCEAGINYSKFRFIAHTEIIWNFFTSKPDSGYSIDNHALSINENDIQLRERDVVNCWPNPFSENVNFSWYQNESYLIKIEIFDSAGRKVKELCNSVYFSGINVIQWNTQDLLSGIYFCKLTTNTNYNTYNTQQLKKIIKL